LSQVALAVQQTVLLLVHRPDVVHTHEHPVHLAAAVAYRALAGRPVRVVHTVHIEPTEPLSWWKRAFLGWLMARCWAVTAVSAETARRLAYVASPPPRTIRVIYGAAEAPVGRPGAASELAFRREYSLGDGPVLCQVGLNFRLKADGAIKLIEALPEVRRRYPRVRLLLVGGGHFQADIEAAARTAGVSDALILTGFIDSIALPLAVADLYCHITFQDACPLSLLEAMHSAKPVVAARRGGIPELVTSGVDGVLVEPEPEEIARAILQLLSEPGQAHALAEHAAQTARARFTFERLADDFGTLLGLAPRPTGR
jgi:glycosyltransferase involved in cell wall biosynthesis